MPRRTLTTISLALSLAGSACKRPADETATAQQPGATKEDAAPPVDREPSGPLGVVDGPPWLQYGPAGEPVARAIFDLDRDFDVVPIDLDEEIPTGLGAIVVPLLSTHTQARLDRLTALIESGVPALVVVDPLPVRHPTLVPGESSEPRGDAAAFLRRFGVTWVDDDVVQAADEPLGPEIDPFPGLVLADPAPGAKRIAELGPILALLPGVLGAADGANVQPLLQVRGEDVELVKAGPMIERHPLFGPRITHLDHRGVAAKGRPWLAVRSPGDGRRADVIVVADLDVLDDDLWTVGGDGKVWASSGSDSKIALANRALLRTLVAGFIAPRSTNAESVEGAALLPPDLKDAVASIEIVDRPVAARSSDPTARAMQDAAARKGRAARKIRLHSDAAGWHVHGGQTSKVDAERVGSLLADLAAAKWGTPVASGSLPDPAVDKDSDATRIITRNARGETLVDIVVSPSGADGRFVARPTFDERSIATLALSAMPSTDTSRWVAATTLSVRPTDVTGLQESTHRIDLGSGALVDRSRSELELRDGAWVSVEEGGRLDGSKVSAIVEALAKLELRPEPKAKEDLFGAHAELQAKGFFPVSGGEIIGERGATILVLRDGTRVHLLFGSLQGERQYVRVSRGDKPTPATSVLSSISASQLAAIRLLPLLPPRPEIGTTK